ncbi:MAG: hypothetical protein K2N35_13100, partial [Muribaculaceae bacterium]|nr:hypothetical protein [Muribaculaceae bacterium]
MIIWSAVVAGCGIIALLGRHAAIYRFGTDEFTGNILFAVFFMLLVGLYFSIQPVFEAIFKRLFSQRTPAIMVAETSNGEQVAIPVNDESLELMQCEPITTAIEGDVCIEDVEFAEEVDHSEFEVVEIYEDQKLIRFPDGKEIWYHIDNSKEDILDYKAYTDSLGDLEEYYVNEFRKTLSEQERYDFDNKITRVKVKSKIYNENCGSFTKVPAQMITPQPDGYTLIEEWEDDVFVTQDGGVYFTDDLDEIIEFYNQHKDHVALHGHLITQQHKCDEAFDKLKRNDEKYTLEQVSFICAYITYAMEQFMEAQELTKLHHNARAWAIDPTASFNAVQLRSDHLSKEDLKHLGYNVGKFLRLRGEIIARFVKHVFEEPFGTTHIRTIVAKLADRNPEKDRIPLLSA